MLEQLKALFLILRSKLLVTIMSLQMRIRYPDEYYLFKMEKELLLKFFEDWDTTISETHTKILAIAEDEKLDPDEKLRLEEELLIELNQFLANLRAEVEKIVKGSPDDIRSLYLTTFNRWRPD
ncbi:hypothetical protein IJI02_00760 [Candidatus Saccharibacteria bacterium]|nr:hypothetical protein [Candidatus Saccharibacteria bacterium]